MTRAILSLIFLATAIMLFFTWTRPGLEEIRSLRSQEKDFNEALAGSKELQLARDEILSAYNSINQSDLERLNKLLPSRMEALKLVITIENIVGRHNLLLKDINIESSDEQKKISFGEKRFDSVPLTVAVAGSYRSFIAFLDDLEKSLNLTDINEVSFRAGEIDSYEFNIKASTYWNKGTTLAGDFSGGNEVLSILAILKSIEMDTGFFENEIFRSLIDFSIELTPEPSGRLNPFAPLE